jgi:hypothetical protein
MTAIFSVATLLLVIMVLLVISFLLANLLRYVTLLVPGRNVVPVSFPLLKFRMHQSHDISEVSACKAI